MKNKIKYIGISLTKEVRDLYADHYKTLIRVAEDDSHKWTATSALGMEVLVLFEHPTTQSKLQISCHPYQSIHDIFSQNPNK